MTAEDIGIVSALVFHVVFWIGLAFD